MPSTLSAFTSGDLVISVYGNGDGSGATYTLDQASAITLDELTTSGALVGTLVLPETTTVVNGATEYAISGEYGSASEGALQLSSDGQSLTIFGYGVNDVAFNSTSGAAIYGNAALGQSTSIAGGVYTAVPRVVADISYNGSVSTTTELYNLYNTNNPRSVATVNGTSFYLSGQSVKGTSTQGVFYTVDGSTTATAIDTSVDTRTAEIVNGVLYVSRDSSQGVSNIASYGSTLPTTATVYTPLSGITGSVTLTAAQENSVNASAVGTVVNLSPEAFFFANSTTLYVADSGFPKAGGIGDGGLQKWSFNGATWVLDYTLSLGLNLVADTASAGTTGLFALTGVVSGGTVQLYATTSTAGETDPSFLYGITDTLSATTPPASESFTQLMAAAPDTIIRGVSFAPTATTVAPTSTLVISGKPQSNVTVTSGSTLTVSSGGIVTSATVLSAGTATIAAAGNDISTIIGQGGIETVLGSATGDDIEGTQLVSAATAVVTNETVENGGTVELFLKGAVASGTVVNPGGTLQISGNATAYNTIVSGGGVILESPKAVLSGSLTFAGSGTLQETAIASAGYGDQAVISGFGAGDTIDVTVISPGSNTAFGTALVSGNTVATITSGTVVQTFTFAGSSIGQYLSMTADTTSGEQIVYVPPAPVNQTVTAGQTLPNQTITSGSLVTVNGGGTLLSATIQSSGSAYIGGADSGTTILAGGNETVLGSATGDLIYGVQLVSNATAVVTSETVYNGGAVDLFLKGGVATNLVVSSGGQFNISGNATGVNTVLDAGATLNLESPKATLSGSVTFNGAATLLVTGVTSAGFGDLAVISGFTRGDTIDIASMGPSSNLTSAVVSGNTVETFTSGSEVQSFIFAGLYSAGYFTKGPDDAGTGVQLSAGTPCYCPGTLILTDRGEVVVEALAIGDIVINAAGAAKPIRWIGRRNFAGRFLSGQTHLLPVCIRAGALGGGLPRRDLRVSPLHAMFIDGFLIPARDLVNGSSIVQENSCRQVQYIHVELAEHDVILAEGAPSETFLDDDSRGMFHNAAEFETLYPSVRAAGGFCAPRIESGYALEAIRQKLLTFASRPAAAA